MKNFKCLLTLEERKEFVFQLFKTKEIRSHLKKTEFNQIIEKFLEYPRFIAEYSNQDIEHAHFYSWFNILILRDSYENKYIQDLYYLHELKHITTLTYDSKLKFEEWKNKMIYNELEAALFSEVQVYDLISNLREKTFNYPIWYDELTYTQRSTFSKLSKERQRAMNSPKTEVEKTLFRYNLSNNSWAEVWRVNYQRVEKNMEIFYSTQNVNEYITNFNIDLSKDFIVFEDEARKFTSAYLQLKKETNT